MLKNGRTYVENFAVLQRKTFFKCLYLAIFQHYAW